MVLLFGILLGQAVHMALTQAGVTVRQPRYYVLASGTLGGLLAMYTGVMSSGYTANLALLVSGLATLSMVAIAVAWHQRHRRAR